jgi:signal transduction histidine kinase
MIHKLRLKFIRIAMAALMAAVILIAAAINVMNWLNVRSEIGETISFLAKSDGMISPEKANEWAGKNKHRKNVLTQSVYFIGRTGQDGALQVVNQGRMETINREEAESLLERAAHSGRESGFVDDYCFQQFTSRGNTTAWIFLNCESYLTASHNLLLFSTVICIAGILLSLLIVSLLSKKAVQPFIRNEQKQKRFITDASHELKAPLAVISANMDVLALKDHDNPWINGTRNQVASMRTLVEDMVYLSRADETDRPMELKNLDLKDIVLEAAEPYQAMAEFQNKTFRCEAEKNLPVTGDEAALQRAVSILCDNAVKYTPEGGTIHLRAYPDGRNAVIETDNPPVQTLTEENCNRLFDRFYRMDEARSRDKQSGYGIGLSIAQAVIDRHGGSVIARMTSENTLLIRLMIPLDR